MNDTNSFKPYRWLKQQLCSARTWLMLATGSGIASGFLLVLQASLLSRIVYEAFMNHQQRDQLLHLFIMAVIVILIRAGLSWSKEVCGFKAGSAVRKQLRQTVWQHLLKLGPAATQHMGSGAVASQYVEQIEAVQDFYAYYLPQMSLVVFIPLAIVAFVFPISWMAGIIFICTAPLIPLFMALIGMETAKLNQKHFQTLARMSAKFLDVLQGISTLKLFNRSRAQAKVVEDTSEQYRFNIMKVLRVAFMTSGVLELFSAVSIALTAVYLGLSLLGEVHIGHYGAALTLQGALFILLLAPEFYLPLRELGTHYHARGQALGAAEELQKILQLQPTTHHQAVQSPFTQTHQVTINCKQLNFSFEQQRVLNNLDFSITPGQHVAIVGTSGAGKTTLLNCLLGFLQSNPQQLYINGIDITDIHLTEWQQHIAWLGQNPKLFPGTIKENLLLANANASNEQLHQALASAHAEFVEQLPEGINTPVGERNLGLSGGQIQRICLARLYLRDANFIILDEPTASIDAESENLLLQSITEHFTDTTLVMSTHRINQLEKMDTIIVLDNGEIKEMGNLAQLMEQQGLFYQMSQEEIIHA
tara:strand:- start:22736 stop:24502 length:1767 start_codon:yes stop_codon:yes gene_type:complete